MGRIVSFSTTKQYKELRNESKSFAFGLEVGKWEIFL